MRYFSAAPCLRLVCPLLVALLCLSHFVAGQRYFTELTPTTEMWSPRDKANVELVRKTQSFRDGVNDGRAVSLSNYFLLYGGSTQSGGANDVWASSNGRAWIWAAGWADGMPHPLFPETFPPIEESAHCQDLAFRQYRAGGRFPGQEPTNDVWMSTDGVRWVEQTPSAEFGGRYLANMVADTTNAIFIAGGVLVSNAVIRTTSGEVWRSTNQGRLWRLVNTPASIETGAGFRAVALLMSTPENDLIWMTGVDSGTDTFHKDVWVSGTGGRMFDSLNLDTPFGRRDDANGELVDNGILVMAGGYGGLLTDEIYNDVWISANGGYSWGRCVEDAEWEDRRYQMTVVDAQGYLWVMGGSRYPTRYADMWKSLWSFYDLTAVAKQCQVRVPACGAGLKCMPRAADTLIAGDGTAVYCNACPYASSTSASSSSTLVAVIVTFVVFAVCLGAVLAYTCYRLRLAGGTSPLPTAAAGSWTETPRKFEPAAGSESNGQDNLYQPLTVRDRQ